MPQSKNRQRLARLIQERRSELGLRWRDVWERAGLTKQGLNTIRFEDRGIRQKSKLGIERALRWPVGTVDRVLEGGEPQPGGWETVYVTIRFGDGAVNSFRAEVRADQDRQDVVDALQEALDEAWLTVSDPVAEMPRRAEEVPAAVQLVIDNGLRRIRDEAQEAAKAELRRTS